MAPICERFVVIPSGDGCARSLACRTMVRFLEEELGADVALGREAVDQAGLVQLTVDPCADVVVGSGTNARPGAGCAASQAGQAGRAVEAGPEAFRITGCDTSGSGAGLPNIHILARSEAGLLYGVEEVMAHYRLRRTFPIVDRVYSPTCAVRGMKGLHWNPDDYLSMLDFLPACKFNFLMLCYGMAPEHCRRFRDPYSDEHLEAIARIVQGAQERFATVCVAINPSLRAVPQARYSGDDDLKLVVDKFRASYDLGVRCFALALDDISLELQRPEDRVAYRSLGEAHVDFTRRLHDALLSMDSHNRLILCPTTYFTRHAHAYPDYTRAIAEGIPDDVELFWTGPDWNSVSITYEDACEYAGLVGRKPFLWLNYPVNDYLRPEPWRLVLAPTAMRCNRLPSMVTGVITNPMRQVEASKLALWSIARYVWDPGSYDPGVALEEACAVVSAEYGCPADTLLAVARAYIGAYNPLTDLASLASGMTDSALYEMEGRLTQAAYSVRQLLPGLRAQLGAGRLYRELDQGLVRFLNFADAFTMSRCADRLGGSVRRHGLGSDALADASHFVRLAEDAARSVWA